MKSSYKYILSIVIIFILLVIVVVSFYRINTSSFSSKKQNIVSAFLRVKNEIKTIEACLESIDGAFDRIVIIHSNEPDDGTVEFMNDWCSKRSYCEIHEYPYSVIPSHREEYQTGDFKVENSLASYYNFGLQFFGSEEWVVKIDADQVYLKEKLKNFIKPFKEGKMDDTKIYWLCGYNSFARKGELVILQKLPINGKEFDHFFCKRKNIDHFIQDKYWERIIYSAEWSTIMSEPVWFHFMKSLKWNEIVKANDQAGIDEIRYLSPREKELFEINIRPLLKKSSYYHLSVPTVIDDFSQ